MKKNEIRKVAMRMRMGRKGVAIIAIAAVLLAAIIIIEGVFFANFTADIEVVKRTTGELAVINAIDAIELAKKALQQAVPYSFYKASYDVLEKGGFCASDENSCTQQCKIPDSIPTHERKPWWRVYDNTYATDSLTFKTYLSNRIAAVYDDYASLFFGPDYCPQPPGTVVIEDKGEYKVHVSVTNTGGGVIEYKSENLDIVEHTVGFNDGFDASTFELFEFAKDTFIAHDKIKSDFNTADNAMSSEGCKNIYLGDFCEGDIGSSEQSHILFCEDQLSVRCSESRRNDPCDFDNDDTVTADEKYNCKLRGEFGNPVTNDDGTFEASALVDDCVKVGHDASFSGQKIDFDDERWVEDCGCMPNHWKIDCVGAATACNAITEGSCGTTTEEPQYGCYWSEWCDDEPGGPNPCESYNEDEGSCKGHGCSFDIDTEECSGTPDSCDSYNENNCFPDDGCIWHEECLGTATPCSTWDKADVSDKPTCGSTESKCTSQAGCSVGCDRGDNCCDLRSSQGEVDSDGNCMQYSCYCDPHPTGWWASYIDVRCDYDYFGTASAVGQVKDVKNSYPIDSSWTTLTASFRIASGNVAECSSQEPMETSEYVEDEDSLCCPAIITHEVESSSV